MYFEKLRHLGGMPRKESVTSDDFLTRPYSSSLTAENVAQICVATAGTAPSPVDSYWKYFETRVVSKLASVVQCTGLHMFPKRVVWAFAYLIGLPVHILQSPPLWFHVAVPRKKPMYSRIPSVVWSPKIHYHIQKTRPLVHIPSQVDTVHPVSSCLLTVHFIKLFKRGG
jgi:hypothetical protein